jgi:mediator of RNA polymerase II transcription subunit 16
MYGPASKNGNSWQYESSFVHAGGPNHPQTSKSAFFCVTVSGHLKMYFPQAGGRQEERSIELENVNFSGDAVTHASIASDKSMILHCPKSVFTS